MRQPATGSYAMTKAIAALNACSIANARKATETGCLKKQNQPRGCHGKAAATPKLVEDRFHAQSKSCRFIAPSPTHRSQVQADKNLLTVTIKQAILLTRLHRFARLPRIAPSDIYVHHSILQWRDRSSFSLDSLLSLINRHLSVHIKLS